MRHENKKSHVNPYVLVILSFALVILIGSTLLCTPFARVDNSWGWSTYIDQLFVSVSATCVTGLCTYEEGIAGTLTFPGQLILLMMIQIGGLGFITVLTFVLTLVKSKLQFKDRYILSQAVNSTSVADVVKFVRKIVVITVVIEFLGTFIGLPVFLQMYPDNFWMALWNSFFTTISAFNNAGFDIIGKTSLLMGEGLIATLPQWAYVYLLIFLMVLIVLGGLSFLVIIDLFLSKKSIKQWRAFTKIIIAMTGTLLLGGFLVFLFAECFKDTNPMTPLDAIFQSVTCRTAGFASYNQNDLTDVSKVVSCMLMFVGGSPLSTAGGVKITTIYLITLAMFSYFRGRPVTAFKRLYSTQMIIKAMSLFLIALGAVLFGFLAINLFESNNSLGVDNINYLFETFSAFGTTGLTTGITTKLTLGSKITLCLLMFLGRLGPMTFFQIFQTNISKNPDSHIKYVEEDFLIG